MKLYSALFASACVLAMAAPASAQFAGTIGADYTHVSVHSDSANIWNINGQGAFNVPDTGFNVQGNVGYSNLSADSENGNVWRGGGAAFFSDEMFRIGATATYSSFEVHDFASINFTNYGGFAEWFPGMFTLGVKGGGVNISANAFGLDGNANGAYVGGEAVAYVMPDLALEGTVDYTDFSHGLHETDFTPQVEWMLSEDVPVSVYGGYTYSSLSASQFSSGNANTFFIGLRFYMDTNGSQALIDRQRSGVVNWGTSFTPLASAL
jgi:hypothetical protein